MCFKHIVKVVFPAQKRGRLRRTVAVGKLAPTHAKRHGAFLHQQRPPTLLPIHCGPPVGPDADTRFRLSLVLRTGCPRPKERRCVHAPTLHKSGYPDHQPNADADADDLAPISIGRTLAAVRSLMRFATRSWHLTKNVAADVKLPRSALRSIWSKLPSVMFPLRLRPDTSLRVQPNQAPISSKHGERRVWSKRAK